MDQAVKTKVNGIDVAALSEVAGAVGENPALGMVDIRQPIRLESELVVE